MLAAPAQPAPKAQPAAPMAAGHINVAVELIGVPNKSNSKKDMRSLRINLRKLADVNGLVSVKAYFLAKDVESDKVEVNSVVTKEVEVTGGVGTTFFVESKPYILAKGKKAVKKTGNG